MISESAETERPGRTANAVQRRRSAPSASVKQRSSRAEAEGYLASSKPNSLCAEFESNSALRWKKTLARRIFARRINCFLMRICAFCSGYFLRSALYDYVLDSGCKINKAIMFGVNIVKCLINLCLFIIVFS